MQRSKKVGRPRKNGPRGGRGSSQPLAIRPTIQVDKTVRFKFTALSNVAITDSELEDLLIVATGAAAGYQLASAVKLRRMEMWVDPVAGGSVCSIQDQSGSLAGVGGPSRVIEDTTLGVTRPAHVTWKPAPGSIQSFWLSGAPGGNQWFVLNSSGAGYLDVHISWVLQDGETPNAAATAVAGATVGRIYLRALDSAGAKAIVPVSFPTV